MTDEPSEHLTTTEARGASTPHMTRYVLGISIALAVIALVVILLLAG